MKIAIIVAMDQQSLIGKNNDLPWKLSADLQNFRRVTMGKPIIMGRNTHESIGRPLPGRTNIIVTKNKDYAVDGCIVVNTIEDAIKACGDAEEAMIMGGASLYQQFLPLTDRLYLTQVHANLEEGDTWFPDWQKSDWQQLNREDHPADEKNEFSFSFIIYDRC
ncbi:MAG: type 3 dihydrofolate reductase [Gammaproteobacteria bacterium]|nr:type 3 dihydrofolate reductase [Gammaproteobacteria bacterium]